MTLLNCFTSIRTVLRFGGDTYDDNQSSASLQQGYGCFGMLLHGDVGNA